MNIPPDKSSDEHRRSDDGPDGEDAETTSRTRDGRGATPGRAAGDSADPGCTDAVDGCPDPRGVAPMGEQDDSLFTAPDHRTSDDDDERRDPGDETGPDEDTDGTPVLA
jgi:hypothetical protein